MDVVQLNFAYNTKKLQFKQSKFLGSYHSTCGKSNVFGVYPRIHLVGAVPPGKRPARTEINPCYNAKPFELVFLGFIFAHIENILNKASYSPK